MLALVGETLVDLVLEEEDPLRFTGALGGSVLNTASALARLGLPVRFFSEVGRDWLSLWSEAEMERRRLNPRLFRHPAPMPLALVRLDREGNAHYSFHRSFQAPTGRRRRRRGGPGPFTSAPSWPSRPGRKRAWRPSWRRPKGLSSPTTPT